MSKMYYKSCGQLVLSLIVLWTTAPFANSCWGSTSTRLGDMTPDQKLLDGSPLLIDCSLNNNTIEYEKKKYHVDSSMILFKFNNKFYRNDRIELINGTVARLRVEKASYSDNGMYYCMVNISGLDHRPFICLSHVTVGYKPQSVTNFRCISLHYRKLHCSWSPPFNPISTTYILEDKFHASVEHLSRKCGNIPSNNSCEWTMDSIPPFRNTALHYNLVLTGTNEFGNNSQLFIVDHYSIIKPNIPKNFRETKKNETSISISWSPPEYIEFDEELLENIIYEIRYFSVNPNHKQEDKSQTIILDGIRNRSLNLSDLIPNLRYNISIRCKTIQSKSDDYWSEFSSILIQTKSDVPYWCPALIPQSFQTDKNMEGMRSITLFWKGIPPTYQNGPDFHYLIKYKELSKRKSRAINLLDKSDDTEVESQNTTYTFNHMKSDVSYEFTIFGVNSIGISSNSSRIVVKRNEEIPHKPSNIDVYSFGGGRYEVQWTKPRQNEMSGQIINYTVFWCQNLRPRPFLCEGAIDWMPTKNTSIALELPNIDINYQFAVSANALGASSGMSWAECIVPIDGRLDKLSEVQLKVENSTTIVVNWKLNCPAQKRVVEGYKIKFCAIDNSEKNKCEKTESVEVDNSAESYVLNSLEPFTKYRITVLAYSDSGPSEESDSRFAITFHDSPEDGPSDLQITNRTSHSIDLMWRPPIKPNGHISHYNIECNDKVYNENADNCKDGNCSLTIDNLQSYHSYKIRVRACTGNSDSLCSPYSKVMPVFTLRDVPHEMDPPRTELINSTTVMISWSPPSHPNGPIDYYLLKLNRNDNTTEDIYNISGQSRSYLLTLDCSQMEDSSASYRPQYSVQMSSVNVLEVQQYLTANFSEKTNVNACLLPPQRNVAYIIGLISGCAFGLLILVLVLVVLIRWMKRKINSYRNLEIELPKGLEVPVLVTNTEPNDGHPFDPFGRSDSFTNIGLGTFGDNASINKNRHGSGLSHTSNDSTELLYNKTSTKIKDNFFRLASDESGQQSVTSSAEVHISSDSGVENDIQLQIIEQNNDMQSINKVSSPLSILDEISSRDSDSSGKDSGLDVNSRTRNKKPKRKPNNSKSNTKISPQVKPFETPIVTNPLYDTPMTHSVCIYSLLANSEPSLFEIPVRKDDNILSDLTKFSKPEMAKSLTNIIESYSPSDPKVNCIICETNNTSSRGSTRTSSPNCPYYKYGIKRQNHIQTNYVTNVSPEKKKEGKVTNRTNNGYITIDSILQNGQPTIKSPKKRFEHGWSQSSYDAEVSSTSSNGDNEQTDLMLTQNNSLTKSCLSFTDCEKIQNKIQNNCSFDDNDSTELIVIDSPINPLNTSSNDLVIEMETQSKAVKEINNSIEKTTPVKSSPIKTSPVKRSPTHLAKDSKGYVLHNALNQMSVNSMKPNLIKNANGYVVLEAVHNGFEGIEMTDYVPNDNVVNNVTQV